MDPRLEKALEFANYMATLNNQKSLLQQKFLENTIHYYNGGTFKIDQQLISFCFALSSSQTTVVLIDDNSIPIQISDIKDFYNQIVEIYTSASNDFFNDYEKIKKNRDIKGLLDL